MVTIQRQDISVDKIYESGQCFTMCRTLPTNHNEKTYCVRHAGKSVIIKEDNSNVYFACSEQEFNDIWAPYFDLSTDYSGIVRDALERYSDDQYLVSAIEYGRGIRILRQDFFDSLISFIISQRKSIASIRQCVNALIYNNSSRFPSPERILRMKTSGELSRFKLGYREDYVVDASRFCLDFPGDLAKDLAAMEYEDAMRELMKIRGVGKKVANCVCLFGLHHMNACPVDVWIQRIFDTRYNGSIPEWVNDPNAGLLQQFVFFYERSIRAQENPFDY